MSYNLRVSCHTYSQGGCQQAKPMLQMQTNANNGRPTLTYDICNKSSLIQEQITLCRCRSYSPSLRLSSLKFLATPLANFTFQRPLSAKNSFRGVAAGANASASASAGASASASAGAGAGAGWCWCWLVLGLGLVQVLVILLPVLLPLPLEKPQEGAEYMGWESACDGPNLGFMSK